MDTDVLIVGAGPTGLMLAGFLTCLGIRPLVIDKKEAGAIMRDLSLVFQPRLLSRSLNSTKNIWSHQYNKYRQ